MTGHQLRRTVHRVSSALVLAGIALALGCGFAFAAPTVQSIQFISGVRKESEGQMEITQCILTYRLLVRGDVRPYRSGVFTVGTTNPAITVLTNQISIPEIDAEQLLLPTTPLMVSVDPKRIVPMPSHIEHWCRESDDAGAPDPHDVSRNHSASEHVDRQSEDPEQDREHHRHPKPLPPFSLTDFSFSFTGQLDGTTASAGTLRVGEIRFLEGGGRPGHEGAFPIQGDSPPAGAPLAMLVAIFGGVSSAAYQLLDISGQALLSGPLAAQTTDTFYARTVIPTVPFRVALSATGSSSTTLTWQSRLYRPASIALRIEPSSDAVSPGQTMPMRLQLNSSYVSGRYVVTMYLPPGFSDITGPQSVNVAAGTKNTLNVVFAVDATVSRYVQYPIVVEAVGTAPSLPTVMATLDLLVE